MYGVIDALILTLKCESSYTILTGPGFLPVFGLFAREIHRYLFEALPLNPFYVRSANDSTYSCS